VLGAGGDLVFDGGERVGRWRRAKALAGVGFYGFGRGEDLLFAVDLLDLDEGIDADLLGEVQRTPDGRCVEALRDEKMRVKGRFDEAPEVG
jgi:hypothetical protein